LIALVTVLIRTKLRRNFIVMKQLIGQINGFFAENIAGMRLVQIFNREAAKHREFDQLNTDYCDKTLVQIRLNSLMRPLMEVINNLGIVLLIWFGLRGMTGGTLQIGVLYAFTAYIRRFFEPINDLAEKYSSIQSAAVSADRIFELLDKRDDLEDLQAGDPMPPLQGRVEFRNVWFAYEEEQWVLRDVSFVMNPGESAAIVGATGAGKSTIISLMLRFYDIQKGSILLDGRDIREFKIVELRRQVAIVLQDVFLFSGSIAENIRLGDEQIDDEQVAEALKLSYADEFINRLSKQMATHVTERGSTFSAGQRQLLSFARAIARRPSIFILDEATANIDTETEQLIQQSIAQVTARCTTIIIAHRLSTIRHSDQILVMADGRLVEIGDHDTLLRHNGRYAELYRAQFAD
ncbi:MAG: ABC transporter ATP-binding protein, partial [Eubacteriales bacterium]|nr:ABC transporter ATP-binding protein [Eubacteriales bacterium]